MCVCAYVCRYITIIFCVYKHAYYALRTSEIFQVVDAFSIVVMQTSQEFWIAQTFWDVCTLRKSFQLSLRPTRHSYHGLLFLYDVGMQRKRRRSQRF